MLTKADEFPNSIEKLYFCAYEKDEYKFKYLTWILKPYKDRLFNNDVIVYGYSFKTRRNKEGNKSHYRASNTELGISSNYTMKYIKTTRIRADKW